MGNTHTYGCNCNNELITKIPFIIYVSIFMCRDGCALKFYFNVSQHDKSIFLGPGAVVCVNSAKEIA